MKDRKEPWEIFFKQYIGKIFFDKKYIIDIGGGLRIDEKRNNRKVEDSRRWILPHLSDVDYKILDPVPDYNPDLVGDIHKLPIEDNSVDAFICIAVLEHVENPIQAVKEMHRCLKSGGYCFVSVPFLYYYHAEKTYYKDYWRFTKDSLEYLFKDFKSFEIAPIRGRFETWLHLSPLGRNSIFRKFAYFLDNKIIKKSSKQVSGYNVFAIKE